MTKQKKNPIMESATTAQRFEAKYPITEVQARAILDYMAPYVETDPYVSWGEPYVINSMYLDNPELRLYWSSVLGEKNRVKLRIRAYTENPEDLVIFEIKRRVDRIILKERTLIHREYVGDILRGGPVPESAYVKPTAKEKNALYNFRYIMESLNATPRAMVRYTREAYMSNLEEPVRITFDRELSTMPCPEYTPDCWIYGPHWRHMQNMPVVLEIKFTNIYPFWVKRLIQRFNLLRDSFAKYVSCLDVLKREGVPVSWSADHNEDMLWSRGL